MIESLEISLRNQIQVIREEINPDLTPAAPTDAVHLKTVPPTENATNARNTATGRKIALAVTEWVSVQADASSVENMATLPENAESKREGIVDHLIILGQGRHTKGIMVGMTIMKGIEDIREETVGIGVQRTGTIPGF